jgi:hypothetical protein
MQQMLSSCPAYAELTERNKEDLASSMPELLKKSIQACYASDNSIFEVLGAIIGRPDRGLPGEEAQGGKKKTKSLQDLSMNRWRSIYLTEASIAKAKQLREEQKEIEKQHKEEKEASKSLKKEEREKQKERREEKKREAIEKRERAEQEKKEKKEKKEQEAKERKDQREREETEKKNKKEQARAEAARMAAEKKEAGARPTQNFKQSITQEH